MAASNARALATYVPNVPQRVSYESAIVEHKPEAGPAGHTGDPVKDLEAKLKFIQDNVPTRISNVSGSTAGSGSGDFHQYRQSRRREHFRLARMDEEAAEAEAQRIYEEKQRARNETAEARAERNKLKRMKKKDKRKGKKPRVEEGGGGGGGGDSGSSDSGSDGGGGDAAPAADLD